MKTLQRHWTVLLIHHSHTDVGYTDSQSRIARFHIGFIDQVIEIAEKIRAGDAALKGFQWTSECFWSIERWLEARPASEHARLIQCIRDGVLALSGTYLHFNEMVDETLMRAGAQRARDFADRHGLPLDSAVSADINGFGWGYSRALHDAGIKNFVTCVHQVHGMAPIGRRQLPFYWETPGGQEILVWNGEHYNLGNALGLCPAASINYTFADELDALHRTEDTMPIASVRLSRYLRQLELDDYPYDFIPIHISGAMTDNAPPSAAAIGFIHRWNSMHEGQVRLQMCSPSELCRRVRKHSAPIPRYRGDWPDWWSDGFISVPSEVRMAREAMRTHRWLEQLAKTGPAIPAADATRIEQNLLLFCEHTFNHSESAKTPWTLDVKAVGCNKRAYAYAAYDAAMDARDAMFADRGELPNVAPGAAGPRFLYKVMNPLESDVTDLAQLYLDNKDYDTMEIGPSVVDVETGKHLEYQRIPAGRGITFCVPVTVKAGGHATLELIEGTNTLSFAERSGGICSTQTFNDVEGAEGAIDAKENCIETPHLKLEISREGDGIVQLIDKASGLSLLATNRDHAPFVPVYEVHPANSRDAASVRSSRGGFGRNRKNKTVQRSAGKLLSCKIGTPGHAWIPVEMDYEVSGTALFSVTLRVWRSLPRIDASVVVHKTSVWEAENLYLALPFGIPGGDLWIDKAGAPMRPWKDQLPETLTDWYTIQNGYCWCADGFGLSVATPDSPLLQLGPLEFGTRRIMGHPALDIQTARPYAWLMTNYWGTNFEVMLGGFHQFNYRLEFGKHLAGHTQALRQCAVLNHGLQTFRAKAPGA